MIVNAKSILKNKSKLYRKLNLMQKIKLYFWLKKY